MPLRAYKFVVCVGLVEEDDDGVIRGEHESEPIMFYGADRLMAWIQDLDGVVKKSEQELITARAAPPAG